jgi:hypothetical protein
MVRWFTLASAHGRLETRNTNIKSGLWSINKAWASCHTYTMVQCQLVSSLVYCSPWYAFQLICHRKRKENSRVTTDLKMSVLGHYYLCSRSIAKRWMMAIVQVQKPVKLQATELTWIGGEIGILEVLAPHLGEPRLVLVTSGLELVCVLILWQILQTNSQAENVNIAVVHRQPSSLNLTMVPLQQQRVWQHQEGRGGRGEVFLHQTNDQVWSLVGSCVSSCMG